MSCHNVSRRRFLKTALAGSAAAALGATATEALAAAAAPAPATGTGAAPGVAPAPSIPQNVLGKTGQRIPRLLLGTVVPAGLPQLKLAYDLGVTYFDTADCYGGGKAENLIGRFVEKSGVRKNLWLTTKSDNHDPRGMEELLTRSLERLHTDYVDMFFLHALTDINVLNAELKSTVERLRKQGKLRFFGFSTHAPNCADTLAASADLGWIDAVMFKYNFRAYGDLELNRAIDKAKEASVGLIAMKTQASAFSFLQKVEPFEAKGFNRHQSVLKAVWEDRRIDAVVAEMTNAQQLEQNVAAARDLTRLGSATMERLQRHADATAHLYCHGCEHLCARALDRPVALADTMRCLMYHDEYGDPARARGVFQALPAELRDLRSIDFSPAARACPYKVDVVALMRRAAEVLEG